MSTIKNCVGLEAEFFLRDKDNELLYPLDNGFSTDEFLILGEFRGEKGNTREETIANFIKEWYNILFKAKKRGYKIDIEKGYTSVEPDFYVEILRKMGTKVIAQSKNIYPEIDLLKLSDAVVEKGIIKTHYLSIGLHIHFSSAISCEKINRRKEIKYSSVKIPLSFGGNSVAEMNLYQKEEEKDIEEKILVSTDRITKPVLYHFIKELDEKILSKYKMNIPLKYRNPGFYELKPWGFEYRSLPFNKKVLDDIAEIVDFSYNLLEGLDL